MKQTNRFIEPYQEGVEEQVKKLFLVNVFVLYKPHSTEAKTEILVLCYLNILIKCTY